MLASCVYMGGTFLSLLCFKCFNHFMDRTEINDIIISLSLCKLEGRSNKSESHCNISESTLSSPGRQSPLPHHYLSLTHFWGGVHICKKNECFDFKNVLNF